MCGIVAYIGTKPAQQLLLEGLKRLEYRGYDSAGLAVLENGKLQVVRAVGRRLLSSAPTLATVGPTGRGLTADRVAERLRTG